MLLLKSTIKGAEALKFCSFFREDFHFSTVAPDLGGWLVVFVVLQEVPQVQNVQVLPRPSMIAVHQ